MIGLIIGFRFVSNKFESFDKNINDGKYLS